MSKPQDDPRHNSLSHDKSALNMSAKTWDELRSQLQATKAENAPQQALLELANCLLLIRSTYPKVNLDLALLTSILNLHLLDFTLESTDYQVLYVLKQKLDNLILARPEDAAQIFKHLADLCRIEIWRAPLGEAGFLQNSVNALLTEKSSSSNVEISRIELQKQALRFIGNACADVDENRDRVLQQRGIPVVLSKFRDDQLVYIAIPALFNICNDHDTATEAAIQSDLFRHCLESLEKSELKGTGTYSYLCLLLDIVCDKVDANNAPGNALDILLDASLDKSLEIEQLLSFGNLIIKLLALESNQKRLILQGKINSVLEFLYRLSSENAIPTDIAVSGNGQSTGEEADEERDLLEVRTTLITSLADASSLPEFVSQNEIWTDTSTTVWKLRSIMLSPLVPMSQTACLMLGNLACSDSICYEMVAKLAIHEAASTILKTASDMMLIHSALGLLRNLALPVANKESLAMAGVLENLQKWLSTELNPQIQLAAASLLRQMINGSIANAQRLLAQNSTTGSTIFAQTMLATLLEVYTKTDEVAIKTELARTVIAILRCVYGNDIDPQTKNSTLAKLYSSHEGLVRPIIDMAIQSQYPVVRSEAWFGLGIMSRDAAGRQTIAGNFDSKFLEALQSAIRGDSAQEKQNQQDTTGHTALSSTSDGQIAASKDRENALVMVHELDKIEDSSILSISLRNSLEQLLKSKLEGALRSSDE